MRDILKYAKKGSKRRGNNHGYDLYLSELELFVEMLHKDGMEGFVQAIRTAYDAGFEAGARMTEKAKN